MKNILEKINNSIGIVFTLIWIIILMLFYLHHHPDYYYSIKFFQYYELIIALPLAIGIGFYFHKKALKGNIFNNFLFKGIGLWGVSTLLAMLLYFLQFYKAIDEVEFKLTMFASFFIQYFWVQIGLLIIMVICFAIGDFLLKILGNLDLPKWDKIIISIGLGIFGLTLLLMILGGGGLLINYIIIPIGILLLLVFRKRGSGFLKDIFLNPIIEKNKISLLGFSSLWLLVFWITINFIGILRPIPFGYDSLTLYIKLPALINDYAALVPGNQPYNWSLFMSLGYLVFNQTEFVLAISFLGGGLSIIAFFCTNSKMVGS